MIEREHVFLRAPRGTLLLAFFAPLLYIKLWLALRRQQFDVIHFTHLLFLPFAVIWGKTHRARIVYDAYEFHLVDVDAKAFCRFLKLRGLLEFVEDRLVSRVDAVLTIDSVGNVLAERYSRFSGNVEVLYNVPKLQTEHHEDVEDRLNGWLAGHEVVVYVGVLSQVKGVMMAIEAISYVREKVPEVVLVMIGAFLDGSEGACRDYVRQRGLESNVKFIEWVSYGEMMGYLARARVGLAVHQPAHRFRLVSRGNGRKFFTYMQASLPIVGPELGQVGQVVRDEQCGILCDTTNPKEIAEAVVSLLQHPEQAVAMGGRGRKAIEEKYNWDVEKEKLLRVYRGFEVGLNGQGTGA